MFKPAFFSSLIAAIVATSASASASASAMDDDMSAPARVPVTSESSVTKAKPRPAGDEEMSATVQRTARRTKSALTAKPAPVAKSKPRQVWDDDMSAPANAPAAVSGSKKPVASSKVAEAAKLAPPPMLYTRQVSEARRLFEAGKFSAAARVYETLPANSPDYLRTREELAWTYLRQENWLKLRGLLVDLNSPLVPLRWRLEGRVLSAMLYLKDCEYEKVRSEIEEFQKELLPVARAVDGRLNSSSHAAYWRDLHEEVDEAILKMKFVRMELRSRLVMLTRAQVIDTPDRKDVQEKFASNAQVYPVIGDTWSDEVFEKRGEGKSVCASLHNAKVVQ